MRIHLRVGKYVVRSDASCGETLRVERRFVRGTVSYVF